MRLLLLLLLALLSGCASAPRPALPAGSYFEGRAGYSKDGPSAKAVLHIPLASR